MQRFSVRFLSLEADNKMAVIADRQHISRRGQVQKLVSRQEVMPGTVFNLGVEVEVEPCGAADAFGELFALGDKWAEQVGVNRRMLKHRQMHRPSGPVNVKGFAMTVTSKRDESRS